MQYFFKKKKIILIKEKADARGIPANPKSKATLLCGG
jgi:hypothetical protein